MAWFLMIILGGSTSQSGVAVDTRQTFRSEAECVVSRDAVRLAGSDRRGQQNLTAFCIPRVADGSPRSGQ